MKVVLVAALLMNKLCAYPSMIVFLVAFIVYQLHRLTYQPGFGLAASPSSTSSSPG